MSESLPPNELAGLTKRLDELTQSVADLRNASTAKETREAREDVSDAEKALKKYAEAHGITLEDAEEALNDLKSRSRKAEIREALKTFTDEDWKDIFPEREEEEETGEEEPPAAKEKPKPKPKPKEEDSAPGGNHWTERQIFSR